jgi:hypothetical protein
LEGLVETQIGKSSNKAKDPLSSGEATAKGVGGTAETEGNSQTNDESEESGSESNTQKEAQAKQEHNELRYKNKLFVVI